MEKICSITAKVISPKVANIQFHMGISSNGNHEQEQIFKQGYVNCHVCLNVQTRNFHTECNASYTAIAVPSQLKQTDNKGEHNCGNFEIKLNEKKIMVIPMSVGVVFSYLGYMLSHRQQIYKKNDAFHPFINIVSYNSRRLLSNMVASFRRYLYEDEDERKKSAIEN